MIEHNSLYEEYYKQQIKRATWDKVNFAKVVALRLLEGTKELGIKPYIKAYLGRYGDCYQTSNISFPYLNLHIQTDTTQKYNLELEMIKEDHIFHVDEEDILVVKTNDGLEQVEKQINNIVQIIKEKIKEMGDQFIPWNIEEDYKGEECIENGIIKVSDTKYFRKNTEVYRLFGEDIKFWMKGERDHLHEPNTRIWLPKLFENEEGWQNTISSDGMVIIEKNSNPEVTKKLIDDYQREPRHFKIIFPKIKDINGDTCYVFKGVFELDKDHTNYETGAILRKISNEAKTYKI